MTSNEQMTKALQEFKPSEYYRQFKAPRKTLLLGKLAKLTLLAYFGITFFVLGQLTTIYSDGILFEIPGFAGYWLDFGGVK